MAASEEERLFNTIPVKTKEDTLNNSNDKMAISKSMDPANRSIPTVDRRIKDAYNPIGRFENSR